MERTDVEIKKRLTLILPNHVGELISTECKAYVLNDNGLLGVGVERSVDNKIYERFNNIILRDATYYFNNKELDLLVLLLENNRAIHEFCKIAEDFVCGDTERRSNLIANPHEWWGTWKDLIGNRNVDGEVYSILAELIIYKYVYDTDKTAVWNILNAPTHDIETLNSSIEVKSTIKKYETKIHVSGEFQFKNSLNPVYLYFVRMEESVNGISVNDVLKAFDDNKKLELEVIIDEIPKLKETHNRNKRYKVLEVLKYYVDKKFPLLNIDYDSIPSNIKHIQYELSLDGLENEQINLY